MTHIANSYRISRTFLSQLLLAANLQLDVLFSDAKRLWQRAPQHLAHRLVLLRLAGTGSLLSRSAMLQALHYHPDALGALSPCCHSAGHALPSTLWMPSTKLVVDLSAAMCALHGPILVTLDAHSPAIVTIALASARSAAPGRTPGEALEQPHGFRLGMASDRGKGVVAGSQAACAMALWVAEDGPAFRDLFEVRQQGERKAYAAIHKAYEAARRLAHAKRERNRQTRLPPYDTAQPACAQTLTRYAQLAVLRDLLRAAFPLCSPQGQLRPPEGVRAARMRLFDRSAALDGAALSPTLKPMRKHSEDIVLPCKQAAAINAARRVVGPPEAVDVRVLAWHQDH